MEHEQTNHQNQNQQIPGIPAYIGNLLQLGIELRLKRRASTGEVYIGKNLYNCVKLLGTHPRYKDRLKYDSFAEKVYYTHPTPLGDEDAPQKTESYHDAITNELRFELEDRFFVSFSKDDIESAVEIVARKNPINPILDYINNLPKWDGTKRIHEVLKKYFGCKSNEFMKQELLHAYSKKFVISIIARLHATMRNPVKCDTVLVLYGRQGKHKSTALGVFALEHLFGKRYFMDTPFDISHKDAYQVVEGKLIVELQELAKRSKDKELEKAFISTQVARFRRSHAKHVTEHVRKCIFVATTNKNMILSDATGSRRFWVVTIGDGEDKNWKIDVAGLRKDIDLLYAEALHCYNNKEPWWLTDEEEELREESASDFADRHPMYNVIVSCARELEKDFGYVQIDKLIEKIYKETPDSKKYLDKNTRQNKNIIADVLLQESYSYKRKSVNKKVVRGWFK